MVGVCFQDVEVPLHLLRYVCLFCGKHGLSLMKECFQVATPDSLPFPIAHAFITIVSNVSSGRRPRARSIPPLILFALSLCVCGLRSEYGFTFRPSCSTSSPSALTSYGEIFIFLLSYAHPGVTTCGLGYVIYLGGGTPLHTVHLLLGRPAVAIVTVSRPPATLSSCDPARGSWQSKHKQHEPQKNGDRYVSFLR